MAFSDYRYLFSGVFILFADEVITFAKDKITLNHNTTDAENALSL